MSGGPQKHGVRPSGPITNYSGPYSIGGGNPALNGNYEFENGVYGPTGPVVLNDDKPGQYWYDKLNGIGDEIESEKHKYELLGDNSNGFVSTVLQRAGLFDNWLNSPGYGKVSSSPKPGATWLPGWGNFLPRPKKGT